MRKSSFLGLLTLLVGLSAALPAKAGIPECNNIRFEGLGNCEVKVSGECNIGCSELGIYKTACATKLVNVCDNECTITADAMCSGDCNTICKADCDNGVNVVCTHNCFTECTTTRDADCAAKPDPEQCRATWDANCDDKCTSQCVTVDGDCYTHCLECCDGSCTASANLSCQTVCQDKQIETCKQEFRADCDASCSGDGALFCDGKFMIAGSQLKGCLTALAAQGINVKVEANVNIQPGSVDGNVAAGLCTYSPGNHSKNLLALPALALGAAAASWLARRRKRSSR